ncbi:MAG: flagellar basal body-associated FliL family protein, partial [Candidatus Latescibacteria bacterium]|nr:flagellar basal body-associated FliL family protein [Candidatus Latescibacterota bacterium]
REAVVVEPSAIYEVDFTNAKVLNPQDYHSIRFLSVKLKFELDSSETLSMLGDDVLAAKMQSVARQILTTTWYIEMDEVEERESLRQKLMTEVNASGLLGEGSVTGVYFQQFILQ